MIVIKILYLLSKNQWNIHFALIWSYFSTCPPLFTESYFNQQFFSAVIMRNLLIKKISLGWKKDAYRYSTPAIRWAIRIKMAPDITASNPASWQKSPFSLEYLGVIHILRKHICRLFWTPLPHYVSIFYVLKISKNCHLYLVPPHTVILPFWTLKKLGLSNFAFKHC